MRCLFSSESSLPPPESFCAIAMSFCFLTLNEMNKTRKQKFIKTMLCFLLVEAENIQIRVDQDQRHAKERASSSQLISIVQLFFNLQWIWDEGEYIMKSWRNGRKSDARKTQISEREKPELLTGMYDGLICAELFSWSRSSVYLLNIFGYLLPSTFRRTRLSSVESSLLCIDSWTRFFFVARRERDTRSFLCVGKSEEPYVHLLTQTLTQRQTDTERERERGPRGTRFADMARGLSTWH